MWQCRLPGAGLCGACIMDLCSSRPRTRGYVQEALGLGELGGAWGASAPNSERPQVLLCAAEVLS